MKKKVYLIITSLVFVIILLVVILTKHDSKLENLDNIEDDFTSPTEEISDEKLLEVFETNNNISINSVLQYEETLYAIGENNSYPYIAFMDKKKDATSIIESNFTEYNGKIIEIKVNDLYINSIIETKNGLINQEFFVSDNQIIPYYKKQLTINYSEGVTIEPKYLVIHETQNTDVGADAEAHYRYWSTNPDAYASTHFVVDSTQIYQMLELNQFAWHVGDNKGYSDILNSNTIGIEIAVNQDGNYELARQNAIELSIAIMKHLNMDISQLKTHNDASGKADPINMPNGSSLWTDFVNHVLEGIKG